MVAQPGGFLLHVFQLLFLIFLLVLCHTDCLVFNFVLQHAVGHTGNGVRGSNGGWGRPQPGAEKLLAAGQSPLPPLLRQIPRRASPDAAVCRSAVAGLAAGLGGALPAGR